MCGCLDCGVEGVITRTAVNSHFCVMNGASVALSQSQHISVSHYLQMWLCPEFGYEGNSGLTLRLWVSLYFCNLGAELARLGLAWVGA